MVRPSELVPPHDGEATLFVPQKSDVVPILMSVSIATSAIHTDEPYRRNQIDYNRR